MERTPQVPLGDLPASASQKKKTLWFAVALSLFSTAHTHTPVGDSKSLSVTLDPRGSGSLPGAGYPCISYQNRLGSGGVFEKAFPNPSTHREVTIHCTKKASAHSLPLRISGQKTRSQCTNQETCHYIKLSLNTYQLYELPHPLSLHFLTLKMGVVIKERLSPRAVARLNEVIKVCAI